MLLFTSCPARAKEFALSMYERAAWELEVDKIEHWARIVTQLAQLAATLYGIYGTDVIGGNAPPGAEPFRATVGNLGHRAFLREGVADARSRRTFRKPKSIRGEAS
jgi:hypothetical protein